MHIKREVSTYQELTHWYDNQYNAQGTWKTSQLYAQALIDLLCQAGLTKSHEKRLLDVACGGAFFLEYCRPSFAQVLGCDISRVGLIEARERCGALALSEANGEFLPFQDQCFDVVTCLGSLEHFLQPERALSEMRRVLRTDGIIMILVPINPDWAIYDIQPTEIVMESREWEMTFHQSGLQTIISLPTDQSEYLKASSGGCEVYCLRPTSG
jgi:ubiquinone/menaquinone biosynthesis C-methylase UbiE